MLLLGSQAPGFSAPDQTGKIRNLSDYRGRWLLLYFYPKDGTPGCTQEACNLRDRSLDFSQLEADVLGVSADSVASHAKFIAKHDLPFPLLSDSGREIAKTYEVKGFLKRSSYLINPAGLIVKAYEKVKPATHAEEVIADLKAYQM